MKISNFHRLLFGLFIFIIVSTIACTPSIRYKILSTLFDGVPNPYEKKEVVQDTTRGNVSQRMAQLSRKVEPQYVFHPPYQEKECASCHVIEEGNRLVEKMPDLCSTCHDPIQEEYSKLHGPVASGQCTTCHNPHMAKFPKLLKREGKDLCLYCHDSKRLYKTETHAELQEANCQECHNPHGGLDKYFLD